MIKNSVIVLVLGCVLWANSYEFNHQTIELRIKVTRLKYEFIYHPVLYLDEPKSGKMSNIITMCDKILDELNERNIQKRKIEKLVNRLNKEMKQLKEIEYKSSLMDKAKSNIHYNYFSLTEF